MGAVGEKVRPTQFMLVIHGGVGTMDGYDLEADAAWDSD
jgi:hypothetical protein